MSEAITNPTLLAVVSIISLVLNIISLFASRNTTDKPAEFFYFARFIAAFSICLLTYLTTSYIVESAGSEGLRGADGFFLLIIMVIAAVSIFRLFFPKKNKDKDRDKK
jgi:cytochrome c biogenesis factor